MLLAEKKKAERNLSSAARRYALITPTRNEAAHIGRTIEGIAAQTVLPVQWIIVSDGSTDDTDAIVKEYAKIHSFIRLVRAKDRAQRDFASKVHAFRQGYEHLRDLDYDFLGNLDADILVGEDYYESILAEFAKDDRLGLAGGVRYDLYQDGFKKFDKAKNSVGGCVQLFRRACFEATGGFIPMQYGGEDAVAEIMARMHGWEVKAFPRHKVYHYRETGAMNKSVLKTRFREGIKDYLIGYHPLFEISRCLFRIKQKRPILLGALVSAAGFCWAALNRLERPGSREMIRYLQTEQLARLGWPGTRRKLQVQRQLQR